MKRSLQNNTLFQGFAWVLGLLLLLGCEPFKLPKKEFPKCEAPSAQIAHTANLLVVNFSLNPSAGTIDNVNWDFGDGKTGTGTSQTHTYAARGTYTVKATLTNRCGQTPVVVTKQITVDNVVVPTVTTVGASAGNGAAIATGVTLVNNGNAPITRFGICYSATNQTPTIADGTIDGTGTLSATNATVIQLGSPPLEEGKEYFFRAFAVNSAGPGYGSTVLKYTVPVVTGLVAHYKFNGNGTDLTSFANHITYGTRNPEGQDRKTSAANGALLFNGSTDYFEASDSQSLRAVSKLTVSVWFKLASLPTSGKQMHLFYKGKINNDSNGGEQYSAKIANGGALVTVDAKQGGGCVNGQGWITPIYQSANLVVGRWYHLVAVFDQNQGRLYLDGEERASRAMSGPIDLCSGGALRFGAQITGEFFNAFHGEMDDIRIYNRDLNQTQITALFNE